MNSQILTDMPIKNTIQLNFFAYKIIFFCDQLREKLIT